MPRKGGIPDRWLDYSNYGQCVSGTRFIAFKVPLNQTLSCRLPPEKHWTTDMVFHEFPNLGMVVDLTNTDRYYNPEVFKARKIAHVKIMCPGHGRLPSPQSMDTFFDAVADFLNDPRRSGQIIGVHCTHGLNRTGYFICKYMINRMGFSPPKAITAFNKSRGHPMERPPYLEALARDLPRPEEQCHPGSRFDSDPGATSRDNETQNGQSYRPAAYINRSDRYPPFQDSPVGPERPRTTSNSYDASRRTSDRTDLVSNSTSSNTVRHPQPYSSDNTFGLPLTDSQQYGDQRYGRPLTDSPHDGQQFKPPLSGSQQYGRPLTDDRYGEQHSGPRFSNGANRLGSSEEEYVSKFGEAQQYAASQRCGLPGDGPPVGAAFINRAGRYPISSPSAPDFSNKQSTPYPEFGTPLGGQHYGSNTYRTWRSNSGMDGSSSDSCLNGTRRSASDLNSSLYGSSRLDAATSDFMRSTPVLGSAVQYDDRLRQNRSYEDDQAESWHHPRNTDRGRASYTRPYHRGRR